MQHSLVKVIWTILPL